MRKVYQFGRENPYDLFDVEFIFDPDLTLNKDYFSRVIASNPEKQMLNATEYLKSHFGDGLLYLGISGSYARNEMNSHSDIDMFAVVDRLVDEKLETEADIKVVTIENLRRYLEVGDPLITNFFVNSKPLIDKYNIESMKRIKPIKESALPYLKRKSHFYVNSSRLLKSIGNKYKAIAFSSLGDDELAFKELSGEAVEEDMLINTDDEKAKIFFDIKNFYYKCALERLLSSQISLGEAISINENGNVIDIHDLFEFIKGKSKEIGNLMEEMHRKRRRCSYKTDFLQEQEYNMFLSSVLQYNNYMEGLLK